MDPTTETPSLPRDHPLAGCEEKLRRSLQHFKLLQDEIRAEFSSGETQLMSTGGYLEQDSKGQDWYVICIAEVFPPSLRYATIIGDMVHNLRSALDHLVFELSFLGMRGKTIPGRVAFPASETRSNWSGKYVQATLLEGVMQKHRAMIYRAQPCYRKKDSASPRATARRKRHQLSDLNNLWNHDKHRMIQPVAVAAMTTQVRFVSTNNCTLTGPGVLNRRFFGNRLEEDTEVIRFPVSIDGPNPYVNVQIEGEGEIGFRNGLPARESLAYIADWVQMVLTRFEREFATERARRLWGLPRGDWIESSLHRRVREVWIEGDDPALRPPGV